MSVDTPPPSERPESVPFKVSPELQKVIGEMNEDEKLAFAQTHDFEIRRQTNHGEPYKYAVVHDKLLFRIRVQDLSINPEFKNLIERNTDELNKLNNRVHGLQRIITDKLDEEREKSFIRRRGELIKKLEDYLVRISPESSKRKDVRILSDRIGNFVYDCHVYKQPLQKDLLYVYQKDYRLGFGQLTKEVDEIEKDLIELGIIIAEPKVKSTHPYR